MTKTTKTWTRAHNKCELGYTIKDVAKIMYMYLIAFKVPVRFRKGKKYEAFHSSFISDLIVECENYVIENPVRLRMPLDLGYMQVLKFDYNGNNVQHLNKYYGKDYNVVWAVHHMFKHAVLFSGLELKKRLFRHIEQTGNTDYLEDMMPGDFFYLTENKYVVDRGIGRFCEQKNHYTQKIPRKTHGMQFKRCGRKLFMS
jgi:hypothetical protein